MTDFVPTRAAGLARLAAFAPRARAYAAGRNTSHWPEPERGVSMLSPYLRRRLVLEQEAVAAAGPPDGAAAKFVSEVFWRTYFKGYLEQHPSVWTAYRRDAALLGDRLAVEAGLRRRVEAATAGQTGIACFDAWAQALVAGNWLHNHVRMWFASIWIFTLRLPWPLGAEFFLRHLLDGDPASNTLSWRWVAGLHTRGKHYVARAENMARYTEGRFDPRGELDEAPEPLSEDEVHKAVPLPAAGPPLSGDVTLLLHDEDLCPETLDLGTAQVRAVAGFSAWDGLVRGGVAPPVRDYAARAVADGVARAAVHFGCPGEVIRPEEVADWVAANGPTVAAHAPVGPTVLPEGVVTVLRPWDRVAWPACGRGFFQLRERIPEILAATYSE